MTGNLYGICVILAILLLSACTADKDLQGIDPNDYYAAHPIENKVESRKVSQLVHFMPGAATLADDDVDALQDALRGISPPAVDAITIRMSPDDKFELIREDAAARKLKQMGYGKIRFKASVSVSPGEAWIDVDYLAVVPPDCPDWRMSPVTTYSNMWQGNTQCAEVVNLGLMVADPHDLVRGTGDVPINTGNASRTAQQYDAGKDFMPSTVNAGGGGSGGGSGGAASAVGGMNSSMSGGASSMGGSQ